MRRHISLRLSVGLLLTSTVVCAIPLYAQQAATPATTDQPDNAALMEKIRDLEDRMVAMEGQIRQLKSQQQAPTAAGSGAPAQTDTG